MRGTVDRAAIVIPAEDLAALAKRVCEREKKSRKDQLEHVKRQALDVYAARQKCKHGEWGDWHRSAGLSQAQAWRYAELGKSFVTNDFSSLPEDEQWTRWQRLSGNACPEDCEPREQPLNGSVNDCHLIDTSPSKSKESTRKSREDDDDEDEPEEEAEDPEQFDAKYSVQRFHIVVTTAMELASTSEKLFVDLIAHKKIDSEMIRGVNLVIDTWKNIAKQLEKAR